MRLLVTVSDSVWGGKHRYMADVAALLRDRGHDLCVAAETGSWLLEHCLANGVPVTAVPPYRTAADEAAKCLAGAVSELAPAVVCSTGRWDTEALRRALTAAPADVVRMLIRHSAFPLEDTGRTRELLADTDLVITTSWEQARRQFDPWVSAGVLSPDQLHQVTSGVSAAFRAQVAGSERSRTRQRLGLGDDAFVFLVGCRLSWEKGVERVLDALPAGTPEEGPLLLIAGDGEEEAALRRRAADHGIGSRVTFLGHRDDMADLLVASDAVVLASTVPETGPLILKEAMAASRPVVAGALGGIPEFVVHEQNGLLVDDDAGLAAALRRLVEDRSFAAALGRAGTRTIARDHVLDRKVDHLEELIDLAAIGRLPIDPLLDQFAWGDVRIRAERDGGFVFVPRTSNISQFDGATFARLTAGHAAGSLRPLTGPDGLPARELVDRLYRMGALTHRGSPVAGGVR